MLGVDLQVQQLDQSLDRCWQEIHVSKVYLRFVTNSVNCFVQSVTPAQLVVDFCDQRCGVCFYVYSTAQVCSVYTTLQSAAVLLSAAAVATQSYILKFLCNIFKYVDSLCCSAVLLACVRLRVFFSTELFCSTQILCSKLPTSCIYCTVVLECDVGKRSTV